MDSPFSPLEFSLLNAWQRDFPVVERPFQAIAEKVGADETAVLATLKRLQSRGAISRVGAVFAPRRIGASTLAALAAPAEQLERIAALVSARPQVNHNYQREHRYNLWFVATAADSTELMRTLEAIEAETGCAVISLPLEQEYHIDLGFDLNSSHKCQAPMASTETRVPDPLERMLIARLQPGLTLTPDPFAELARGTGLGESKVLDYVSSWIDEGLIKRFGVVVRHHELGFRANAMLVFDVADHQADEIGWQLASETGVTLCYRRRRNPDWPYNLYCMVHGRSREQVVPIIDRLSQVAGTPGLPLFSTRRFKQCGARYFSPSAGQQTADHA
jgi:DNA-binding Lrp family transcriptional regulator